MAAWIAPALSFASGLFGRRDEKRAQRESNAIARENLELQRQAMADQMELAKADRQDAFGNVVGWEDGKGFTTRLTPLQQAIIDSQQTQQTVGLQRDAPRVRAAAERQDNRSIQADDMFDKYMREYGAMRRAPQSEEIANSVLLALEDRKGQSASTNYLNQAIRTGVTPRQTPEQPTLAGAIMRAKQAGKDNFIRNDGALSAKAMQEISGFGGIADRTSGGNVDMNNQASSLGQMGSEGMSSLINAIKSGASAQSQAYSGFNYSAPSSNIFGDLANSLRMYQGAAGAGNDEEDRQRQYELDYYKATGSFPSAGAMTAPQSKNNFWS